MPSAKTNLEKITNELKSDLEAHSIQQSATVKSSGPRLLCLDVFRGINIVLMLLVNNIALGDFGLDQLGHAPWNQGMRIADLVFPWFLFMVGLSMPFGESHSQDFLAARRKAVRRFLIIFAWGLFLSSCIEARPAFTLGVLQLIAMAYFGAWWVRRLALHQQVWTAGALLVGYFIFVRFVPFPGGWAFEEQNNILRWINETYLKSPFRIAGLLSVIPTVPLVLFGAWTADWLRRADVEPELKIRQLALFGSGAAIVGQAWSLILPYNKPVWTPPYIVTSAGLGLLLLATLYWLIEYRGRRDWTPAFALLGANALLAYVAPIAVKLLWFKNWTLPAAGKRLPMHEAALTHLREGFGPVWGGALYTGLYIAMWWAAINYCSTRRWFLKA